MDERMDERIDEELVEEFVEASVLKHKKMTRKIAVILFAGVLTLLILTIDPHRDFNLLLTSRLIQVLFVLSFSTIFFYRSVRETNSRWIHEVVDTASVIQVFLLLFTIVNFQFASISTVHGSSMEPSFYEDETIIVSHLGNTYERFDVVVIQMDEDLYYIKRIIGLPGEHIEIRDNQIYVNGFLQEQNFLADDASTVCLYRETSCSFVVGEGEYFVLGDNRAHSEDSRIFGTIKYEQIKGKVVYQFDTLLD